MDFIALDHSSCYNSASLTELVGECLLKATENKAMIVSGYNAAIRKDGDWWIGWIEEIPGVNSQGATRDELLANLKDALGEAIEMNREDARNAAGSVFEEVVIEP